MPHPLTNDADIARRARDMRAAGKSPRAICAALSIPRAVYDGFLKADTGVPLNGEGATREKEALELEQVVHLHEQGFSNRKIARQFGISHVTIGRMLKRYRDAKEWRSDERDR